MTRKRTSKRRTSKQLSRRATLLALAPPYMVDKGRGGRTRHTSLKTAIAAAKRGSTSSRSSAIWKIDGEHKGAPDYRLYAEVDKAQITFLTAGGRVKARRAVGRRTSRR